MNFVEGEIQKLRPREEFLVSHIQVTFCANQAGHLLWLNAAWVAKTGHPIINSVGRHCEEFVHADDVSAWTRLFAEAVDGDSSSQGEVRIRASDGRWLWMVVTMRHELAGGAAGDEPGVSGIMVDVSEQRATQRENSELLLAVNAALDGIARTTSEGIYTHLNRAHLTMFGYESESELLGKTWRAIYTESEAARIEAEVFPILISKGCWSGTATAMRRDGSTFPEDLSLTLLPGGGIICICRDATERVQALNAWQQSEARWQLAAASIQEGLWDFDVQTGVLHLSPRWMELLGLASHELAIGTDVLLTHFCRRIHLDDIEGLKLAVRELLAGASDRFDLEVRLKPSVGSYRWLQARGRALFDSAGVATRIVGSVADIAARKAQEELAARNFARERELVELKSHFIAMASHELRTPVATISLSVELLEKHGAKMSESRAETTMAHMRGAASQLRSIVANLLILGESDDGKLSCNPAPLDLRQALLDLASDAAQVDEGKHPIEVLVIPPELQVVLDAQLVRSILLNLASNACKYSPPGALVTLRGEICGNELVLQVSDRGIGIPHEDQGRLFSHFFRASNATEAEGSGLGLVIVKRCCEAHGATVTCESMVGQGTTFTVRFPYFS